MELINRYTRRELRADEVYTFGVILCDNEVDRDFERFDTAALPALAALFVGKTGIADHSLRAEDQTSRLYDARVVTDPGRTTSAGEPYAFIKAKAYMPRTPKNRDLIADIDAGIKKEASVGCSVGRVACSVCGEDLRAGGCRHVKGKRYGGAVCHGVLSDPADAYEWSFVAVPAQPAAGVTKSYTETKGERTMEDILKALRSAEDGAALSFSEARALLGYIEGLEKQAADGREYREELTLEVIRMGLIALPQMQGENLSGICERLTVGELRELKKVFDESAGRVVPLRPQLVKEEKPAPADNGEFKI